MYLFGGILVSGKMCGKQYMHVCPIWPLKVHQNSFLNMSCLIVEKAHLGPSPNNKLFLTWNMMTFV